MSRSETDSSGVAASAGCRESPERVSPLHAVHSAAGATFTDFAGWQMPVRYSSELAEHHAVRTAAGIFDLSHMAEFVVIGPEAAAALDYALAGNMSTMAVGQARYTLVLSRSGGVVDDLVVYRTGEKRFLIVANAANRDVVAHELRDRTAPFTVESFDESDDLALIAVQGPRALDILVTVSGFALDGGSAGGSEVTERLSALGYYRSIVGSFREHPVLFARTGYTGEDGFEMYIGPDYAVELWEALVETGAKHGLVPAGLASRDTLRLEAGMPLYGQELSLTTFPAQAGIGRVVALDKPVDFVGRAASEEGAPADALVLVGLIGDGKRAARADYPVREADPDSSVVDIAQIGIVTSGALSPTLGVPIAMAYVPARLSSPGTVVSVDIRGTPHAYTVTRLPFYSRKKH